MDFRTHNGTMTVLSLATGDHRTIRCSTQTFADGTEHRVVSMLIGPDRWQGFAFADADGIRLWSVSKGKPVREFLAKVAASGESVDGKFDVLMEGTCRKCGRPLTHPESIESGIGPICAGRE